MKLCCYIIPYFGKFPDYFPLFLKSCEFNPSFNWLIFTDDDTIYNFPKNVKKINLTFSEFQNIVQSKFDFKIALRTPYKLCDYKPAYGYLFEEYLTDYMYWGHCDVDTIMGNLSHFLTYDFMKKYDKLFCLGHMTLYKNTFENNRVFMSHYNGAYLYKSVYTTDKICWFDEEWNDENNINRIFLSQKKNVFLDDLSFNVYFPKTRFLRTKYVGIGNGGNIHGYMKEKYKDALYLWKTGCLMRFFIKDDEIVKEEFLYIHLQHRKMKCGFNQNHREVDIFKIVPNSFQYLEVDDVTINNFQKIKKYSFNTHCWDVRLMPKIRKIFNVLIGK